MRLLLHLRLPANYQAARPTFSAVLCCKRPSEWQSGSSVKALVAQLPLCGLAELACQGGAQARRREGCSGVGTCWWRQCKLRGDCYEQTWPVGQRAPHGAGEGLAYGQQGHPAFPQLSLEREGRSARCSCTRVPGWASTQGTSPAHAAANSTVAHTAVVQT